MPVSQAKSDQREYRRRYYQAHKEVITARAVKWTRGNQRRYYQEHKEEFRARQTKWRKAHLEQAREYQRNYKRRRFNFHPRQKPPDERFSTWREYYLAHPEAWRARRRAYYATHKEKYREYHKRSDAKKREALGKDARSETGRARSRRI